MTRHRSRRGVSERNEGGLLGQVLETDKPQEVARLARLLALPTEDRRGGQGRERARFAGLLGAQIAAYTQLAGAVEAQEAAPVEVPADLLARLLSGDPLKMKTPRDDCGGGRRKKMELSMRRTARSWCRC